MDQSSRVTQYHLMTDIDETLVEKPQTPRLNAPTGLEDDCRDWTPPRRYIITGRELPYIDQLFRKNTQGIMNITTSCDLMDAAVGSQPETGLVH